MDIIAKNVGASTIKMTAGKMGLTITEIPKIDGNPRNAINLDVTPAIIRLVRTTATERDRATGESPPAIRK